MKPLKRRSRIHLEGGERDIYGVISFNPGPHPYIWIGENHGKCLGWLSDKKSDQEKPLRMVETLLEAKDAKE